MKPDVVHLHNLHNLGLSLVDETFARGIRTIFSTHNYWLGCARNYLFRDDLSLCDGPGDAGRACATCVGSRDAAGYAERRSELRERFSLRRRPHPRGVGGDAAHAGRARLPGGDARRRPPGDAEDEAIWEAVGRDRRPGRGAVRSRSASSARRYPHKGPSCSSRRRSAPTATCACASTARSPRTFAERLRALDQRGVVELAGAFSHSELPAILAGLERR